jgi:hypothetical protein
MRSGRSNDRVTATANDGSWPVAAVALLSCEQPAHRHCCQGIDFLMLRADADKFDMDDTNSEAVATNSR